jgi:galactose mutarotase-like enzyme
VANRIGGAKFTLNGVQYNLTQNEGSNQLHGGLRGFDKVCTVNGSWFKASSKTKLNDMIKPNSPSFAVGFVETT